VRKTISERSPRKQCRAKVIKPAAGVEPMVGASVARVCREQVEVVELATPLGLGVHLLQGDHVCLGAVHEARHFHQIVPNGLFPQQHPMPAVFAPVGDVQGDHPDNGGFDGASALLCRGAFRCRIEGQQRAHQRHNSEGWRVASDSEM